MGGSCTGKRPAVKELRTIQREDKLPCIGCHTLRPGPEEASIYYLLLVQGLTHMEIHLEIRHCLLSSCCVLIALLSSRLLSWRMGYCILPLLGYLSFAGAWESPLMSITLFVTFQQVRFCRWLLRADCVSLMMSQSSSSRCSSGTKIAGRFMRQAAGSRHFRLANSEIADQDTCSGTQIGK